MAVQTLSVTRLNKSQTSRIKCCEPKTNLFNSLTPLKGKGKRQLDNYLVFDIETNNWKEFVIGGIYDGTNFKTYDTLKGLCDAFKQYKNYKIFAHFGGIFDFLFLINHWGLGRMLSTDLIMRGSSIFSFSMDGNTFYDSCGILPFSLEKAAKAFKVEHQKLDIDHKKIKRITPELIKYLKHDCLALHECIKKFYASPILRDTNFKPTLASQSLEVMRKYIPKPIPAINNKEADDFIRQGYAGGRVEIFRPIYENTVSPLYYYDFNSLYPSVMQTMDVPGKIIHTKREVSPLSFVEADIESPKNIYLPLLWQKTKFKFTFPSGNFRGVFPGVELLEAEKYGYKIKKIHRAIHFENIGKIFENYIGDLYTIKSQASDPVLKEVAKFLLNAGYGRLGIKRERESLTIDDGSNGLTPTDIYIGDMRLAKKSSYFKGFSHPGIAAMITAHARIKLYRAMQPIQNEIYYCDTDSIVTTAKLPISTKIGDLKLEGTANLACFLLPKTYIFDGRAKMKGFPKEFAQSKNFTDFKEAMEGDLKLMKTVIPGKLARIKSTKKHGSVLKVLNNSTRQLKATYDKRLIYSENNSWNSRPIDAIKNP